MEPQFKNLWQKLQQGKQFLNEPNQCSQQNENNKNLLLEDQNHNLKMRYFLSPSNKKNALNQSNNPHDINLKQINIKQYQRLPVHEYKVMEQMAKNCNAQEQIENQTLECKAKITARKYSENDDALSEIRSQSRQEAYKTPCVVNTKKLPKAFQNFVNPNIEGKTKIAVRQRNKSIVDKLQNNQNVQENTKSIQALLKQDNNYFKIHKKRHVQSPKCLNSNNNKPQDKFNINMDYFQKRIEKSDNEQNNEGICMKALKRKHLEPLQLSPKYQMAINQKQNCSFNALSNAKLNEMITLSKIAGENNFRKVVHAPTLTIFTITEFQITEPIGRQIKNLLLEWKNNFDDLTCFSKIKEIFWNSPEGENSVLMEYQNDISLSNLLSKLGRLPENIIQGFSSNILTVLSTILNCQFNIPIKIISPESFFLDKDNNLFFTLINSECLTYMNFKYKMALLFSSIGQEKYQIDHLNEDTMQEFTILDIQFEIGLLFFYLALGEFAKPNKKYQCEHLVKNSQTNMCCLFHSIEAIAITNSLYELIQQQPLIKQILKFYSQQQCKLITEIINNQYSKEFIKVICTAFSFSNKLKTGDQKFALIKKLPFFHLAVESKAIKLDDLIKLHQTLEARAVTMSQQQQQTSEVEINRICSTFQIVLPYCSQWFSSFSGQFNISHLNNLTKNSKIIQELAKDLHSDQKCIFDKLSSTLQTQVQSFQQKKLQINNTNYQASITTTTTSSSKSNFD